MRFFKRLMLFIDGPLEFHKDTLSRALKKILVQATVLMLPPVAFSGIPPAAGAIELVPLLPVLSTGILLEFTVTCPLVVGKLAPLRDMGFTSVFIAFPPFHFARFSLKNTIFQVKHRADAHGNFHQ